MSAACHECGRTLQVGESAWASEWKVIGVSGASVTSRIETRYSCDDCEAKR